ESVSMSTTESLSESEVSGDSEISSSTESSSQSESMNHTEIKSDSESQHEVKHQVLPETGDNSASALGLLGAGLLLGATKSRKKKKD
ncbi:TPA: LPXTG cell wall anchor domain-containing protein, partial [Streptococcus agalactiae]|nr:LPXTG cell wall anchor domain-containing protein [Streptococcus agalactiae]HEN6558496.1 LPXTG cell wall anchor domain-containing protein [Streptococcus agalactiae]HEN6698361.1 LPXTG cell wall anchor domain-containing protein [Streptococcus agalactiae]HEN7579420.1 LPXTG cell wall anchor domain-containing protein [Streptococcus agalactiae]HEN8054217.1 LPXTG cell wall anchor domain-containing protein [Streptococcus agalactiae]